MQLAYKDISKTIRQVQKEVFSKFIWTSDEQFNKVEDWRRPIPDTNGIIRDDCDGFSMECWHRLRQLGFPEESIFLCFCKVETGGGHLILGVNTNKGFYFLDCRHRTVQTGLQLVQTGYSNFAKPQYGKTIKDPWIKFDPTM